MDEFYQTPLPVHIEPAYPAEQNPVCICFAANDLYAPHLSVTLYSLLVNASQNRCYDILIMTKDITKENRKSIQQLSKIREQVSIRFLNMSLLDQAVNVSIDKYYSTETNYRLYLLSGHFKRYHKMLYLDSDLIVRQDICGLYDTDMNGYAMAAAEDVMFEVIYQIRNPIFYRKDPYNVLEYFQTVIGLKNLKQYFNAGVLLLDLPKMRNLSDERGAIQILREHAFTFHDQDTLNYLVKGSYLSLDVKWNYLNAYENVRINAEEDLKQQFQWLYRDAPEIVHYVSGKKPWNTSEVALNVIYQEYEQRLKWDRKENEND